MLPMIFNACRTAKHTPNLWDPFSRDVEAMLTGLTGRQATAAHVDVWEDDKQFVFEAELPGLTHDDINVTVDKGVLTIEAEQKDSQEHKDRRYCVIERRYDKLVRRFRLPETVDGNTIDATLKDGVLTLSLGKKELPKPTKIEVQQG